MRVLVSGFGPFGLVTDNVSSRVLPLIAARSPAGVAIDTVELPVVFGEGAAVLVERLQARTYDLVISLGVAESRSTVAPELVALNHIHARIPDTDGRQPLDQEISRDGPFAYRATIPVYAIAAAIRERGVAAEVSYSAGTYVCNHVMYEVLHHLAMSGEDVTQAGFVHLPGHRAPGDAALADAVVAAIEVCARGT